MGPVSRISFSEFMTLRKQEKLRARIAIEAARLMTEQAISDYHLAKTKAAQNLGLTDKRDLPANHEIEQAVRDYQLIFHADTQPQALKKLRQAALDAMTFFSDFQPRLVGDVLSGIANQHSRVMLHLFADYPEQVSIFLMENDIPCQEKNKRMRYKAEQYHTYPQFCFIADNVEIELTVFNLKEIKMAPGSAIDGKPMQRANIKTVERLLIVQT